VRSIFAPDRYLHASFLKHQEMSTATMTTLANVNFQKPGRKPAGTLIVLAGEDLLLGPQARGLAVEALIARAAAAASFKGKAMTTLDLYAPAGIDLDRLIVLGCGKVGDLKEHDWLRLGGAAIGAVGRGKSATVLLERPDGGKLGAEAAAEFGLGIALRSYAFDKYKKDKSEDGNDKGPGEVTLWLSEPAEARRAFVARQAAADGVALARDLVNEPPNVLGPLEFAARAEELKRLGVEVEILTEVEMRKLAMGALLGVAQGSARPPRLVVMRWNGTKGRRGPEARQGSKEVKRRGGAKARKEPSDDQPIAFVGKGVVFDTGGISIKPAGGMEDMKGDMAGAAAVTGLMHALAARQAKVNAVGVIALVENMPDGAAQRPGDIVTAMSGKTIEIINTDAEGRLVLADAVHYTENRFKPKIIIDLATLTGAIVVSLGHLIAGLFSTDDDLAAALVAAGEATGERVWRMPLGPDYDKLIDSKFADVKNTGGRNAGAITGAQFIKRFVKETPWAHLDIAGAALDSPQTEINRSWSSGFGVRLLDRLVRDKYEG
jgi:leucyl aminopeptidase